MDAKPQKPSRGFRVHGDENAVPFKTLHSRNKSSPALSTMAAKGAAQAHATKRTAFGDVSNIANGKMTARDDMALAGKGGTKENITVQALDKKHLARPAQRPMSLTSGLKGFLNNVVPNQSKQSHDASTNSQSNASGASNIIKPNTIRRNTVASKGTAPSTKGVEVARDVKEEDAILPEVRIKPQQSMQPIPEASIPSLPPAITSLGAESLHDNLPQSTSLAEALSQANPAYFDPPQKQADSNLENLSRDGPKVEFPSVPPHSALPQSTQGAEAVSFKGRVASTNAAPSKDVMPGKLSLPALPDPEEYWDDIEDDEEHIDDDGYVTARSFKSRGDNITGNATTVIVPHINARVRKEIAAAKQIVESLRTEDDIEDDHWDSTMVAEYSDEIFDYMRDLEVKMQPNPHYMDHQTDIQWSMRSVLMDWLVQVHGRFQLLPETLFLCVNYIDRFLSCKIVSLGKLQLVGATAIFIAAKYEEINCPSVAEIVYMVDQGYSIEEILKAERFMLGMLQFELGWPGPMSFLRRISKADDYDLETRTLAKYFLEITIMDERFLGCPPSFSAAGAHCLARLMLKKGPWSASHVYYSNYTYSQLHSLVLLILECCDNPTKHHAAVYEKYLDKRYKCASHFVRKEIEKGFRLMEVGFHGESAVPNYYPHPQTPWSLMPMSQK